MPLKGEAKKIYQREYMRQRRLKGSLLDPLSNIPVRPEYVERPSIIMMKPTLVESITTTNAEGWVWIDADGNVIPEMI